VWPPATIDGRRYVDGSVRSSSNADYAAGASRVLVIVPLGTVEPFPREKPLAQAVEELRAGGADVAIIEPGRGFARVGRRESAGPVHAQARRGSGARAGAPGEDRLESGVRQGATPASPV
jgi:NTE family protein